MIDNKLATFLRLATPEQRERCAKIARTPVSYMYQLAGRSKHKRKPNVLIAVGIEQGTTVLNEETDGRLPIVTPHDLAAICREDGAV